MGKLIITINGLNISGLESFFDEIDRVLTKNLDWQTGHNLNAFNDLLYGGFGVHDYEQPIKLIWDNLAHSISTLGQELTNDIIKIIKEHEHIEFEGKE